MITNRDQYMSGPYDFDQIATIFYNQTGYMRPGKDDARGIHTREQRIEAWEKWLDSQKLDKPGNSHAIR
jgi:hypothetical protein